MKRLVALVAAALVIAAGCGGGGGGGSNFKTLADLQAAMAKGDVACKGTPGPYRKHKDDMSLGVNPIESLECTIDGIDVTASRWKSKDERVAAMSAAKSLVCGFSETGARWIESGTWVVSTGGSTKEDASMMRRIGKALGVEPTTTNCGDKGVGSESSDSAPLADKTGSIGKPIDLGDDTTMTLTNPRLGGDDSGPWIEVDVAYTNHSSTSAQPPLLGVVCAGASSSEGSQADSTFDPNVETKPGATTKGTLNLLPTGNERISEVVPKCKGPAVFRFADDGPTVPVPTALLNSYNSAARSTGSATTS